jgi:ubiquinone/menaquinone biosynthesis C-methylase UbiE
LTSVHDRLADLVAAQEGDVIADLGCGPGRTLAALTGRNASLRLVGLDVNLAGLAEAAAGVGASAALMVRADLGQPLPLADGCVDALVCHNVIELLPEPEVLFAEVVRVLRPNGRAVLSHTDFAGLIVFGADAALTGRILAAYATIPQPWMSGIDPYAAGSLPGPSRARSWG